MKKKSKDRKTREVKDEEKGNIEMMKGLIANNKKEKDKKEARDGKARLSLYWENECIKRWKV